MVMNYNSYETQLHMLNHYKRLSAVKSVVNTRTRRKVTSGHSQKSVSRSSISSRYSTPTFLPPRHCCEESGCTSNCQQLRAASGPAKTRTSERSAKKTKTVKIKERAVTCSPKSTADDYSEYRSSNGEEESIPKRPVPTPRQSPTKPPPDNVPDYEYLQFSLRITEDIIRNGLYTNKEMQRVFTSHVEANRGRLNMQKMQNQIDNLCKELNFAKQTSSLRDIQSPQDNCSTCKGDLISKIVCGEEVITDAEIQQLNENELQEVISELLITHEEKINSCYCDPSSSAHKLDQKVTFIEGSCYCDVCKCHYKGDVIEDTEKDEEHLCKICNCPSKRVKEVDETCNCTQCSCPGRHRDSWLLKRDTSVAEVKEVPKEPCDCTQSCACGDACKFLNYDDNVVKGRGSGIMNYYEHPELKQMTCDCKKTCACGTSCRRLPRDEHNQMTVEEVKEDPSVSEIRWYFQKKDNDNECPACVVAVPTPSIGDFNSDDLLAEQNIRSSLLSLSSQQDSVYNFNMDKYKNCCVKMGVDVCVQTCEGPTAEPEPSVPLVQGCTTGPDPTRCEFVDKKTSCETLNGELVAESDAVQFRSRQELPPAADGQQTRRHIQVLPTFELGDCSCASRGRPCDCQPCSSRNNKIEEKNFNRQHSLTSSGSKSSFKNKSNSSLKSVEFDPAFIPSSEKHSTVAAEKLPECLRPISISSENLLAKVRGKTNGSPEKHVHIKLEERSSITSARITETVSSKPLSDHDVETESNKKFTQKKDVLMDYTQVTKTTSYETLEKPNETIQIQHQSEEITSGSFKLENTELTETPRSANVVTEFKEIEQTHSLEMSAPGQTPVKRVEVNREITMQSDGTIDEVRLTKPPHEAITYPEKKMITIITEDPNFLEKERETSLINNEYDEGHPSDDRQRGESNKGITLLCLCKAVLENQCFVKTKGKASERVEIINRVDLLDYDAYNKTCVPTCSQSEKGSGVKTKISTKLVNEEIIENEENYFLSDTSDIERGRERKAPIIDEETEIGNENVQAKKIDTPTEKETTAFSSAEKKEATNEDITKTYTSDELQSKIYTDEDLEQRSAFLTDNKVTDKKIKWANDEESVINSKIQEETRENKTIVDSETFTKKAIDEVFEEKIILKENEMSTGESDIESTVSEKILEDKTNKEVINEDVIINSRLSQISAKVKNEESINEEIQKDDSITENTMIIEKNSEAIRNLEISNVQTVEDDSVLESKEIKIKDISPESHLEGEKLIEEKNVVHSKVSGISTTTGITSKKEIMVDETIDNQQEDIKALSKVSNKAELNIKHKKETKEEQNIDLKISEISAKEATISEEIIRKDEDRTASTNVENYSKGKNIDSKEGNKIHQDTVSDISNMSTETNERNKQKEEQQKEASKLSEITTSNKITSEKNMQKEKDDATEMKMSTNEENYSKQIKEPTNMESKISENGSKNIKETDTASEVSNISTDANANQKDKKQKSQSISKTSEITTKEEIISEENPKKQHDVNVSEISQISTNVENISKDLTEQQNMDSKISAPEIYQDAASEVSNISTDAKTKKEKKRRKGQQVDSRRSTEENAMVKETIKIEQEDTDTTVFEITTQPILKNEIIKTDQNVNKDISEISTKENLLVKETKKIEKDYTEEKSPEIKTKHIINKKHKQEISEHISPETNATTNEIPVGGMEYKISEATIKYKSKRGIMDQQNIDSKLTDTSTKKTEKDILAVTDTKTTTIKNKKHQKEQIIHEKIDSKKSNILDTVKTTEKNKTTVEHITKEQKDTVSDKKSMQNKFTKGKKQEKQDKIESKYITTTEDNIKESVKTQGKIIIDTHIDTKVEILNITEKRNIEVDINIPETIQYSTQGKEETYRSDEDSEPEKIGKKIKEKMTTERSESKETKSKASKKNKKGKSEGKRASTQMENKQAKPASQATIKIPSEKGTKNKITEKADDKVTRARKSSIVSQEIKHSSVQPLPIELLHERRNAPKGTQGLQRAPVCAPRNVAAYNEFLEWAVPCREAARQPDWGHSSRSCTPRFRSEERSASKCTTRNVDDGRSQSAKPCTPRYERVPAAKHNENRKCQDGKHCTPRSDSEESCLSPNNCTPRSEICAGEIEKRRHCSKKHLSKREIEERYQNVAQVSFQCDQDEFQCTQNIKLYNFVGRKKCSSDTESTSLEKDAKKDVEEFDLLSVHSNDSLHCEKPRKSCFKTEKNICYDSKKVTINDPRPYKDRSRKNHLKMKKSHCRNEKEYNTLCKACLIPLPSSSSCDSQASKCNSMESSFILRYSECSDALVSDSDSTIRTSSDKELNNSFASKSSNSIPCFCPSLDSVVLQMELPAKCVGVCKCNKCPGVACTHETSATRAGLNECKIKTPKTKQNNVAVLTDKSPENKSFTYFVKAPIKSDSSNSDVNSKDNGSNTPLTITLDSRFNTKATDVSKVNDTSGPSKENAHEPRRNVISSEKMESALKSCSFYYLPIDRFLRPSLGDAFRPAKYQFTVATQTSMDKMLDFGDGLRNSLESDSDSDT